MRADERTLAASIGRSTTLGVGLAIALALTIAAAGAYGLSLVATSTAELASELPRGVIAVANVRRTFDATVILDRGWLLSGRTWYLQELQVARRENAAALARLSGELDGAATARLVVDLERAVVEHRAQLDRLLESESDAGGFAQRFEAVAEARREVARLLDDLESEQVAQLDALRRDAVAQVRRAGALLVLVSGGGLALAVVGGVVLARVIVQSSEQLAAEVAARRRAEEEAQAAIGERDRLLSAASHELRSPLQTISMGLAHLSRVTSERDPCPSDTLIRLLRNVGRATRLLDTLLEGARLNVGRLNLEAEDVDLAALVREVVRREQEATEGPVSIRVDAPDRLVGRWDPLRLDQVLTNLLGNAIKYGEQRPVEVTLEETADGAILVIRDEGPGIEPRDQARIFEPFQRASKEAPGFGLGLWITRGLVEAHGGTIRVESAPGQGAAFVVELPRSFSGDRPAAD